jgi:hypothetical protein
MSLNESGGRKLETCEAHQIKSKYNKGLILNFRDISQFKYNNLLETIWRLLIQNSLQIHDKIEQA